MKRMLLSTATLGLFLLVGATTQAGPYRNQNLIQTSGNGIRNTIAATNCSYAPGCAPGARVAPGLPPYPGVHPGARGPRRGFGFGGVNRNVIRNSGNGVGNRIFAANRAGLGGYGYPPYHKGVNVNVITNSGNGAGNHISAGNRGPGWMNINVITNSGNGIGNHIHTHNGR